MPGTRFQEVEANTVCECSIIFLHLFPVQLWFWGRVCFRSMVPFSSTWMTNLAPRRFFSNFQSHAIMATCCSFCLSDRNNLWIFGDGAMSTFRLSLICQSPSRFYFDSSCSQCRRMSTFFFGLARVKVMCAGPMLTPMHYLIRVAYCSGHGCWIFIHRWAYVDM